MKDGEAFTRSKEAEDRPWGRFSVLAEGKEWKAKHLLVRPGGRLSLQNHQHRSEYWVVVRGVGHMTVHGQEHELRPEQGLLVPQGALHRIENRGSGDLELIEVQRGTFLGEDDQVRYADDYGRIVARSVESAVGEEGELKRYKAVILAAGLGTRLFPITREVSKSLLPIGRKPILNYLVDMFMRYGVREIGIPINHDFLDDFVWWKRRFYADSSIVFIPSRPLGTFGNLAACREWIGDNSFFATNGDELKEVDLGAMARFHREQGRAGTIALAHVEDPRSYGVVVHEEGRVLEFLEKPEHPPSSEISAGLYVFAPSIFDRFPRDRDMPSLEEDLFPALVRESQLSAFPMGGRWVDCGTWERYAKAQKEWGV